MTFRYSRNGKLHFLRIGRACFSFCIAKPGKAFVVTERHVMGATAFALAGYAAFILSAF